MTQEKLSRRAALIGGATLLATTTLPASVRGAAMAIHVLKDPNCGCCSAWINILKRDGFDVTVEEMSGMALARFKLENGIPQDMSSCHTARIQQYMIEGHVPTADIRRLLETRPDAIGLAVPGMPYGSPGMGPESEREAYDVILIRRDGRIEIFTHYKAA